MCVCIYLFSLCIVHFASSKLVRFGQVFVSNILSQEVLRNVTDLLLSSEKINSFCHARCFQDSFSSELSLIILCQNQFPFMGSLFLCVSPSLSNRVTVSLSLHLLVSVSLSVSVFLSVEHQWYQSQRTRHMNKR